MPFDKEAELPWFKEKILSKIIEKIDKDKSLEVISVDLNAIGNEEAFMLTTCYRANVLYSKNGKQDERIYVVKKSPNVPPELYDVLGFGPMFQNEINGYVCIVPAIEQFIQENFPVPDYIYSEDENHFSLIVLEDFKLKGWQLCPDKYNLSLDHILLAVKYIAKFHGIGFAMKSKDQMCFDILVSYLKESRFISPDIHPDWALQIQTGHKRLDSVTRKHYPEIEPEFINKVINLVSNFYEYGKARTHPKEPFATLCHGDFLRNNLAFKYDEQKKPIDAMMFDLQTMRYCSPMIDLSVLLLLSAFADVRHKRFDEIFETYSSTLISAYEKYAKEPVPSYLSHESMLKEYISFMPYALNITAFFLMNLVEPIDMTSEDFVQLQRTPEEIELDGMTRGGETVDKELAHQMMELYTLSKKYDVDITECITKKAS